MPAPSFVSIKKILELFDKAIAENEAEDKQMLLEPFLYNMRCTRKEWDYKLFQSQKPYFRRLIDQKLLAEYSDPAIRKLAEAGIMLEFPELY